MQPCFDSATGFLVTFALICSRFRDLKKKRSFSRQFEYKVQSIGSRIYLPGTWHHAFIPSFCASAWRPLGQKLQLSFRKLRSG